MRSLQPPLKFVHPQAEFPFTISPVLHDGQISFSVSASAKAILKSSVISRKPSTVSFSCLNPLISKVLPFSARRRICASVSFLPINSNGIITVSYTHLRAHETRHDLV